MIWRLLILQFQYQIQVGTYEDFILSTLSTQNNFTVFIDKTQKERKELLTTFMGTDIFDYLYQSANDKISETQTTTTV